MNKTILFLFPLLIIIRIKIKVLSLEKCINFDRHIFLVNACKNFLQFDDVVNVVNKFYEKKIFSCLVCAILLKHFSDHNHNLVFFIGVRGNGPDFDSHAWVEDGQRNIIFGNSQYSKKFNIIYQG